jgi:hypothetical protein
MICTRLVRGSVSILSCNVCDTKFPIFDYEVESDSEEIGLYSAALCDGRSLVLIELNLDEWLAAQSGELTDLPLRIKEAVGGEDYRLASILRVETPPLPPAGISFVEFRKLYKAPTVVYSCPCCVTGEAVTSAELTCEDYRNAGGRVTALNPLELR